ncbi:MAG: hypothetical protein OXE05_06030 [Chloroflexi bacterium]|nr:hypothetical protein [Chloroflexota bacterium]
MSAESLLGENVVRLLNAACKFLANEGPTIEQSTIWERWGVKDGIGFRTSRGIPFEHLVRPHIPIALVRGSLGRPAEGPTASQDQREQNRQEQDGETPQS